MRLTIPQVIKLLRYILNNTRVSHWNEFREELLFEILTNNDKCVIVTYAGDDQICVYYNKNNRIRQLGTIRFTRGRVVFSEEHSFFIGCAGKDFFSVTYKTLNKILNEQI